MKKLRPCLRCDRKFITTPEVRICTPCKKPNAAGRATQYLAAERGFEYNLSFNWSKRTRSGE